MLSKKGKCILGVRRPAPILLQLLLLLLVQLAATQTGEGCSRPCVPLPQCPQLLQFLSSKNTSLVDAVRKATCPFVGKDPMVCCPSAATEALTSLLPKDCGVGPLLPKVHGGTVSPLHGHPWMAVLGYTGLAAGVGAPTKTEFLCGGAVINQRYVVTAAHCVDSSALSGRRLEVIRLGEWDLSTEVDCEINLGGFEECAPPVQDFTYEVITPHPNYNSRTNYSDDIALIRLSRPIDLSGGWIQPVCLPPQGLDVRKAAGHREALMAGWGFTEKGTSSEKLLQVFLPFVDNEQCSNSYNVKMVDGQLCMGGRAGQDSCAGDSGGPLTVSGPSGPPYLLIGVVSYGPVNCGREGYPGVYTSVSHYRDWIEQNLKA